MLRTLSLPAEALSNGGGCDEAVVEEPEPFCWPLRRRSVLAFCYGAPPVDEVAGVEAGSMRKPRQRGPYGSAAGLLAGPNQEDSVGVLYRRISGRGIGCAT